MHGRKDHISSLVDEIKSNGESSIDRLIQDGALEQFILDFKLLKTSSASAPRSLHEDDRNNLAKAISGFGNSEGGILIWGVHFAHNRNGQLLQDKRPFENPITIVALLNEAVSRSTVPVHETVENFPVLSIVEKGKGYAVTVVPKSELAPHQSLRDLKYYMRAGDSFVPVPHGILEGLFGRRPQANIIIMFTIPRALQIEVKQEKKRLCFEFGIQLVNAGRGIARDHFINVVIHPPFGGSDFYIKHTDPRYEYTQIFGTAMNCMSKPDYRIAPFQRIQPVVVGGHFAPPFERDLVIELTYGAGTAVTKQSNIVWKKEELLTLYKQYAKLSDEELLDCDFGAHFLSEERTKETFY